MELASRQHCTGVDRNPIFSIIRNALKFNLRESKFSKFSVGGMLPDPLVVTYFACKCCLYNFGKYYALYSYVLENFSSSFPRVKYRYDLDGAK